MIRIDFLEPTTDEWHEWRVECEEATQELIDTVARGATPKITKLYKGQEKVYKDLHGPFCGKCAYCESLISADQPGHVEHFRPKGG